jgi:hypothetical protein
MGLCCNPLNWEWTRQREAWLAAESRRRSQPLRGKRDADSRRKPSPIGWRADEESVTALCRRLGFKVVSDTPQMHREDANADRSTVYVEARETVAGRTYLVWTWDVRKVCEALVSEGLESVVGPVEFHHRAEALVIDPADKWLIVKALAYAGVASIRPSGDRKKASWIRRRSAGQR